MRKTLIAMLGLAALVVWALPAFAGAGDPPYAREMIPLDARAGAVGALAKTGNNPGATLSGTIVKSASATTTFFLYPGACQERALGTWAPKSAQQADSLDTYATGSTGSYDIDDQSLKESIWNKVTTATPAAQRPAILTGTASLWCGKFDANFLTPGGVGYPNQTLQLLYVDTGAHGANYTMTLRMNQSSEWNYDFVYLIGGGGGLQDPIVNSRPKIDELIANGVSGPSTVLVTWTGTILSTTPGAGTINTVPGAVLIEGAGGGNPNVASLPVSITIPQANRALYVLFTADCLYSTEDGNWPFGHGIIWDELVCSDNGNIFTDGTAPSGTDPSVPPGAGTPLSNSYGNTGYVAARITPGQGELWQIVDGNFAGTSDNCQLQKNDVADHMFFGVDPSTRKTIPGQFNSIVTCTLPVPVGTASIIVQWGEYLDLSRGSGYVQYAEYRFYKDATWSNWANTRGANLVVATGAKLWATDADELAQATQADSVQVRFNLECIASPAFALNGVCQQVDYGVMYDDLYLQVLTGVPAPIFTVFGGNQPQATFVDGTMTGTNCTIVPCWPGIRGSQVVGGPGNSNTDLHDNVNCPLGDSMVVHLLTGLRKEGMGINWKQGYDKSAGEGLTIAHTNASYNAAFDQPRIIYRLFDPTTKTWSPFDSSVLDANGVLVNPGVDTTVNEAGFRWNWPPRDKAGLNLPGGFSINGVAAYNNLAFLPKGTRMQSYYKAVDIAGGVSYQFTPDAAGREVEDLPTLPGGSVVAPDIIAFDILPRAYAPGTAGSLLAGRTNTPILNLDQTYGGWSFAQDPMTQALRGLGVRADRYRLQGALGEGHNFGGHELVQPPDNQRQERLSNHFPNINEYAIRESLSGWYRIMIQTSHLSTTTRDDESDARLLEEWWASSTPGSNGGDRCLFISGDDYFNVLMNAPAGDPSPRRRSLGQNAMGVNSALGAWNGTAAVLFPTVDDRFSAPGAVGQQGVPLAALGYNYPVDGGCPGPNRFDALTKIGSSDAQNAALYPLFAGVNDVAAVAMHTEKDAVTDNDRAKALAYGFSIQYVRKAGIATGAANYVHSGVQERMQIMYKFLASCRGARSGAPADTAKCWPCPTDANLTGNWAALAGFQTGQYGPLYPIQDNAAATGIEVSDASGAPRVNKLDGNFPNPFNPQTTIRYSSATAGKVTIRIFNVGGQLVRTLNSKADAGANEVRWNGRRDDGQSLASGVYFYKVKFADGTESGSRMALVK
jgi:hypothetical protein